MKRLLSVLLAAGVATPLISGAASAEDVKIGILLGYTGPIESIAPVMAQSAEMAMKEVSDSGKLLNGAKVMGVRGDSTCVDAAAATAAAERLVTSDKVSAVVGGDCSGVTGAVLQNVARPNGIVMISPSATSPALSTAEDDGLFFRTAPSDARQGEVMAEVLVARGVKKAAVTYTNNDYGKGLADSFGAAFAKAGGAVTISAAHEDGKADYSAEVGALAAAGGDILVVCGYVDQGGKGIIQAALDSGAYKTFFLPDGMYGNSLIAAIGKPLDGSYGSVPGIDNDGSRKFIELAKAAGFDGTTSFAPESYDAAALLMLAMQAAKSSSSADIKGKILQIANGPGEKILPGELAKGLELIAAGTAIDYDGATAVDLVGAGESKGNYRIYTIKDGTQATDEYK